MPGKLRDRATTFMKTPKANSDIVFGEKCNLAGGEIFSPAAKIVQRPNSIFSRNLAAARFSSPAANFVRKAKFDTFFFQNFPL